MTTLHIELTYELERKWTKALRSGEYAQTTGTLRHVNSHTKETTYCCLGVLGELLIEEGIVDNPADGTVCELPYELAIKRYGSNHALVAWNDTEHADFATIADRIESGQVFTDRGNG